MNILSLDGGGMFNIHTAIVLDRLESALPGTIAKTDLFVGTSAGGIQALAFASGATTAEVLAIAQNPKAFFTRSILRESLVYSGVEAKYDNSGRLSVLTGLLGSKTLGDLKPVAVQTLQLNTVPWSGTALHNLGGTGSTYPHPDASTMLAVDAGMATTAAPTYFPSYKGYIDGGTTGQNNPCAVALSLALDPGFSWPFAGTPMADIRMLSIGRNYPGDTVDRANWDVGYIRWLPLILNLLLTGPAETASGIVANQLGNRFFRHSPMAPNNDSLDDYDDVGEIEAWANSLPLQNELAWLAGNW